MSLMESKQAHLEKYFHNKDYLDNGIKDGSKYPDWEITVIFYCGVHIVEAMLAEKNIHVIDHQDRKDEMENIDNIDDFRDEYIHLYQLSRKARYKCFLPKLKDVYDAQVDLDAIKSAAGIK